MASGQILAKFQNDYKKMEGEVTRWRAFQDRHLSLMRTVSNILTRLPMLGKVENYGDLRHLNENFPKRLQGKQVVETEKLIKQAQTALHEMSTTVATMEKIYRSSERTVGQNKSLSTAARCVEDGPIPSINDALDGLRIIWQMHHSETILQERLAAEINYATDPQELSPILVAMQDMPNIDRQKIDDVFDVIRIAVELSK